MIVKQKSRYELQRLENIILKDLAYFFKHTPDLEHEFLPDVFAIINEEVQSIKENLSLSRLAFDNSDKLSRYIQYHQHGLLTLAGHLLNYAAPAHLDYARRRTAPQTFSQILYQAIEDLLDFLRTPWPRRLPCPRTPAREMLPNDIQLYYFSGRGCKFINEIIYYGN